MDRCGGAVIVTVGILSLYFHASNKKADRGEKVIDNDASFRYTL